MKTMRPITLKRPKICRECGCLMPSESEAYVSYATPRTYVCPKCQKGLYFESPDENIPIEMTLILPDGRRILDREFV